MHNLAVSRPHRLESFLNARGTNLFRYSPGELLKGFTAALPSPPLWVEASRFSSQQEYREMRQNKLTCPSESPQHPTPPFPIAVIIADQGAMPFS